MSRSPSDSSRWVVPLCGMQSPRAAVEHAFVYDETVIAVGPVNVELAGVVQFTLNFHVCSSVEVTGASRATM